MELFLVFIIIQLIIAIGFAVYKIYTLQGTLNDIKSVKTTQIIIGTPDVFNIEDEKLLTADKQGLQLMLKKIDTRISILFDSLRIPGEQVEFKQGKINMLLELRNELRSLYNRTPE